MRKSHGVGVHHEKKSDGGELTIKKRGATFYHKRKSDEVKADRKKKSDGVRVDHEKDRWGGSSP